MENHIKVRIGLMYGENEMQITPTGISWSTEWRNRLYDKEEEIRSKIILQINESVGNDWHVRFVEFTPNETFLVDIYCQSLDDYVMIGNTITECIKGYKLMYDYRGTVNSLLQRSS